MEVKLTDDIGLGNITAYSFYNSLLNNDIKTVSDLLDEDKINELLKRCRTEKVRNQLLGFIDLVKHELFGSPLPADLYLEQLFIAPQIDKKDNVIDLANNRTYMFLMRMGFTDRQAEIILFHGRHKTPKVEEARLIDVFESIPPKYYDLFGPITIRKINTYLDVYHKRKQDSSLEGLYKELEELQQQKNKISLRIARVEETIEAVKEVKGSVAI